MNQRRPHPQAERKSRRRVANRGAMRMRRGVILLSSVMLVAALFGIDPGAGPAAANNHPGQSVNVAFIGRNDTTFTGAGTWPTTGSGTSVTFASFNFFDMDLVNLSAANLGPAG